MLNWVAVLRRVLQAYHVKTLQELGMSLGIPMRSEDISPDIPLPWTVLEIVVAEKRLSWDWLLTGKHFQAAGGESSGPGPGTGDEKPRKSAAPTQVSARKNRPPRIETREFARTLLDRHPNDYQPPEPEPLTVFEPVLPPPPPPKEASRDEVVRELEEIKASMQRELEQVETILRERRSDS